MARYVALLRGIGPTNPNMKGEKLRGVIEKLGFQNVSAVINSGNVVFDSRSTNIKAIEAKIEKAWPKELGFTSTTIIRSQAEVEKLIKKNPFKGVVANKNNYCVVTFFKDRRKELCAVIDMTDERTPEFMRDAEKKFGKTITTRTWKTIERIYKKMKE